MIKEYLNPDTLPRPKASFSRGLWLDMKFCSMLFISGTASVGPNLETLNIGNFEAQVRHTYQNIIDILKEKNLTLKDVVNFRVYLKDITKYYDEYCDLRDIIFKEHGITENCWPSSTCIQAKICREELLVEIEGLVVIEK